MEYANIRAYYQRSVKQVSAEKVNEKVDEASSEKVNEASSEKVNEKVNETSSEKVNEISSEKVNETSSEKMNETSHETPSVTPPPLLNYICLLNNHFSTTKFCSTCGIYAPPRSYHCRFCNA